MKRTLLLFVHVITLLGLVACSSESATVTGPPTASPTATALPPTATATAEPTPTQTPTPQPTVNPGTWWHSEVTIPIPRGETTAAEIDGLIYVPGGIVSVGYDAEVDFTATDTLIIYDPATDSWSEGAPMPYVRHHQMSASLDGKLYVFGGGKQGGWGAQSNTLIYDPVADRWSEGADLPDGRLAGSAIAVGEYIYIIGGAGVAREGVTLRYEPATDSWEMLAAIPTSREHLAAVLLDGKIYALAGRFYLGNNVVEAYDIESDTWESVPPMNEPRAGIAACVIDGKIYVAGGELFTDANGFIRAHLVMSYEVFDPETETWTVLGRMPIPLHGVSGMEIDGVFYMLAGSIRAGTVAPRRRVLMFTP